MYEEKYVKRGEIYTVRLDTGVGSEQGVTRPGLIISSDGGNATSSLVVVCYLTTRDHNIGIHYGPTKATGRPSYIQCEQIFTVSKERLGRLLGSLSENEMQEVGNRLDEVLDLGYVDDTPLREKEAECDALRLQLEELKVENARLKQKDKQHDDELLTRDVEIAVAKRMYEKAVGIIAAMRAEPDLPENPKFVKKNVVEESKKPEPPKKPVEPKLVDINTATFGKLRSIGLTNNIVLNVMNSRPYKKVEDLKKVAGINVATYRIIEKKICCIPVPEEPPKVEEPVVAEVAEPSVVEENVAKVNVNTATVEELKSVGLSVKTAQEIRAWRNKHGNFDKLDDLLALKHFGNTCMKRYGHRLEV